MKKYLLIWPVLFCVLLVKSQTCPTAGTSTILTPPNTYFPAGQVTVTAGASSITLAAVPAGYGTNPISAGDILLIIQMQGAEINSTNNNTYGSGVAGGSGYLNNANNIAGNMEYAIAAGSVPVSGGTLTLSSPVTNTYKNAGYGAFGQYTYQVMRVPVYFDLTLGANITTASWNGVSGGVIAFHVVNNFDFAGFTITAAGKGFRGGATRQLVGGAGANTDFASLATLNNNGAKGEGIAGTPRYINNNYTAVIDNVVEGYPGGSNGQGAPGNAGGGGTDGNPAANNQNSGGSGGANGGSGGRGGNSWSTNLPVGGVASAVFAQASASRVVMGGGGGGGTSNNGTGTPGSGLSSSGAAGGGIVILEIKNIISGGIINVSGANGNTTVTNDGSGGGGAGGSVLLVAGSGLNNVTINANGGKGGSNSGGGASHGPGGGGGGGVFFVNGTANAASSAANGIPGTTAGGINYGAVTGTLGSPVQNVPLAQFPKNINVCVPLPLQLLSFNYIRNNQTLKLQWQTTNEVNVKEYIIEKSVDGINFSYLSTVAAQTSAEALKNYQYTDAITTAVSFYRLKMMDIDGQFSYSKTLLYREASTGKTAMFIYPNPVTNKMNILLPSGLLTKQFTVTFIDPLGRKIFVKEEKTIYNQIDFAVPGHIHGLIIVQLNTKGSKEIYHQTVLIK